MVSNEEQLCELCSLSCGRNPVKSLFGGQERYFCCVGCLNVYTILLESGVIKPGLDLRETDLFKQSLALGLISNPEYKPDDTVRRPEILDGSPVSEIMLQVSGMWCASCAWLIEYALKRETGVLSASVFFASDLVKVRYYPQFLPPHQISRRISQLGYQVNEYKGESSADEAERTDLLLRLGLAVFFWINVMVLNIGLYAEYIQDVPETMRHLIPILLMTLATPTVFYSGLPILRLAWKGVQNRVVRMETLLALGILSAYIYSVQQVVTGGSRIYFDTTCAIVTLVLIGKWIERSAKTRTSEAITLMHRMMPNKARLLVDRRERFVPLDALEVGDVLVVKAGERVPVDGLVVSGETYVDESLLTGESKPIPKLSGSRVSGGSLNSGSVIEIEATSIGSQSAIAQIVKVVEQAVSSRSRIERVVDRVSRVFVPGVILVALSTFVYLLVLSDGGLGAALIRAITVLVIACPCALGIATPLAITAAVSTAARNGVLVGDSQVLEKIRKVDIVAFDKTGTITEGKAQLVAVNEGHLEKLAAIERFSEHPFGQAVVSVAQSKLVSLKTASDLEVLKGLGIRGRVESDEIFVGNRQLVSGEAELSSVMDRRAEEWERSGHTVSFYGWGKKVQGLLVFGDQLRSGIPALVRKLQQRGIHVVIVSGDSVATTEYMSARAGADEYWAEILPTGKAEIIERMRKRGLVVAMVGDGINDAPALAAADLGIAVSSGTDLAMRAASIVLMGTDVDRIPFVFDLASKTIRIIRQNLFWAFLYNTVGVGFAVAGWLSPIMAAAAMVVSSLSVIGNSLRLTGETGNRIPDTGSG